jgi:hypothetical protein
VQPESPQIVAVLILPAGRGEAARLRPVQMLSQIASLLAVLARVLIRP